MFHVALRNDSTVAFGTFGYCILNVQSGGDYCTGRMIGYQAAHAMAQIEGTGFSEAAANTSNGLTNVMVLHPVACGIAFVAFLISLGAGVIGSLVGVIVAFLAWVITLVVMATDAVAFGILKNDINDDGQGAQAYFGSGFWTLVAAFIMLFLGMVIVFFTCCSARRQRKRERVAHEPKNDYGAPATGRRRWYNFRRTRY
ncbi:hypothetical protein MMC10_000802 [Thelotrema lepadinum]|nr:hypothetical protein [Thelotrema lepadinum]